MNEPESFDEVKLITVHKYLTPDGGPLAFRLPLDVYETYQRYVRSSDWWTPDQEHMVGFYLNQKHNLVAFKLLTLGLVNATLLAPLEVFRPAFILNCMCIILCHNHPSGDPTPSSEDIRLTRQLVTAEKIVNINIMDHVVVVNQATSPRPYLSIREAGLCEFEGCATGHDMITENMLNPLLDAVTKKGNLYGS